MPYFFTPSSVNEVPPVLPVGDPEQSAEAHRLFRFFRSRPAGVNVYLYKTGTLSATAHGRVTETDPVTLYDSSGNPTSNGWQDLELVFWGGCAAVEVTASQKSALESAGYTVATV